MLRISGLDEKFNTTINTAIEKLKKRDSLIGLILFGSIAKGQSHSYSDIDIYAVGEREKDRTERFLIDDIPVQVQWRSEQDFIEKLKKPKRVIPVLAEGIIIYDPKGFLKSYLLQAKEIAKGGAEPLNVREKTLLRAKLSDGLYEVSGLINNNCMDSALLLMEELVFEALMGYYELNCWWKVSRKKVLSDVKLKDYSFYEEIEKFLLSDGVPAKYQYLKQILHRVLALAGGEIKEYILIWKE